MLFFGSYYPLEGGWGVVRCGGATAVETTVARCGTQCNPPSVDIVANTTVVAVAILIC